MASDGLKVKVFRNATVAVADLDTLPSTASDVYIETAEFRNVMSINAVASELGITVRQLRRLISSDQFPKSSVRKGQKQFWLAATVRDWQKLRLQNLEPGKSVSSGRLTKWVDEEQIEREENKRDARLHPDAKRLMVAVREMRSLMSSDQAELERRHPKLRSWLRSKKA